MVSKPSKATFYDPSHGPQSASVVGANAGQQRKDAASFASGQIIGCPVGPIAQNDVGLFSRPSKRTGDAGHLIDQGKSHLRVVNVGGRDDDFQRNAASIGQDVAFAAVFRPIGWIRPGVRPPETARTLALSMTASEASMPPARPSRSKSFSWMRGQTPARVQSRKRRQQVTPDPQPSSAGTNRQGMPVRKTYTMPLRQARSDTRGRPPRSLGRSGGRSGWTSNQRQSGTNVNAMASPPCYAWHCYHRLTQWF